MDANRFENLQMKVAEKLYINNTWRIAADEALFDPNFGKNSGTAKLLRQKFIGNNKSPSRLSIHVPPKKKEIEKRAAILQTEGFNLGDETTR